MTKAKEREMKEEKEAERQVCAAGEWVLRIRSCGEGRGEENGI